LASPLAVELLFKAFTSKEPEATAIFSHIARADDLPHELKDAFVLCREKVERLEPFFFAEWASSPDLAVACF
jgi:hypothetical protein